MGLHYAVRQAIASDCGNIIALIREAATDAGEQPDEVVRNTEKDLQKDSFGEDAFYHCLVVEAVDDKDTDNQHAVMVGYAMYFYSYSSWIGRMIYLEDLYLQAAHRGKGLGRGLVCKVAKIGAEKGCKGMQWIVQESNHSARRLYEYLNATDKTKEDGWRPLEAWGETYLKFANMSKSQSNVDFL